MTGPRSPASNQGLSPSDRRRLSRLIKLAKAHRRVFGKPEAGLGVAATEALLVIARDGPMAQAAVAKELERDRASVSRAVSDLETRRLVRGQAPAGLRRPHYEVTARGMKVVRERLVRR